MIKLHELKIAMDETHTYVDLIHLQKSSTPTWQSLLSIIHCLDHMQRLHERCDEDKNRAIAARKTKELSTAVDLFISNITDTINTIESKNWEAALINNEEKTSAIFKQLEPLRDSIMTQVAAGKMNVPRTTDAVEAIRWLKRVSTHINRITCHLNKATINKNL